MERESYQLQAGGLVFLRLLLRPVVVVKEADQIALFGTPETRDELGPAAWRVRVSRRARRISIQVQPHGAVEIVTPPGISSAVVRAFAEEHADWVANTRRRYAEMLGDKARELLPAEVELAAIGRRVAIEYVTHAGEPELCETSAGLVIRAPDLSAEQCWPLLREWLRKTGKRELPARLAVQAEAMGARYRSCQVRLQKTRWGSCSPRRVISLNAAVLFMPAEVMRYLFVHELCHLRHMNHSAAYWDLVASWEPAYREHEAVLNDGWLNLPLWVLARG